VVDPNRSLFFFHYNTNKRGITLDLERPDGRRLVKELVRGADVCCHIAGYYAATAVLAAIYRRASFGHGQHVDVSMQEAAATMSESPNVFYSQDDVIVIRRWGYTGDPSGRRIFPCRDGYVDISLGPFRPDHWPRLIEWLAADGSSGDLGEEGWLDRDWGTAHLDALFEQVEAWTRAHDGYELFRAGQQCRLEAAPVNKIPAVLRDPQLEARGFFVKVDHPELGETLTCPGAPYDFSETPWQIRRRAPLLGEHNEEIYRGELKLTARELREYRERGVV
jgi:crotonobetainyl-CoA:carnitine CoA-transferase CaiB-like acyl-CoA transferase